MSSIMLLSNQSQRSIDMNNQIFFITAAIGLGITILGSLLLLNTFRKITIVNPLAYLVLYTAFFDSVFAIMLFLDYNFNWNNIINDLISLSMYISAHCSLACTCIISCMYFFLTRARQKLFLIKFKTWVLASIVFFIIYDTADLFVEIFTKNVEVFFVGFWPMAAIMIVFIIYSNIKLIFMLKANDFELEDKTPAYLSITNMVLWTLIMVANFLMFCEYVQNNILNISINFLTLSLGFVNYLIGISRLKKMIGSEDQYYKQPEETGRTLSIISFDKYLVNSLG